MEMGSARVQSLAVLPIPSVLVTTSPTTETVFCTRELRCITAMVDLRRKEKVAGSSRAAKGREVKQT
jgi:hypothetical protein